MIKISIFTKTDNPKNRLLFRSDMWAAQANRVPKKGLKKHLNLKRGEKHEKPLFLEGK
jgi:hypothetical protein